MTFLHPPPARAMARRVLEKLVDRTRFNDSSLYSLYLRLCHPAHSRRKRAERRFYQEVLRLVDARRVLDIGANAGDKTRVFSSLVDQVVSVEPSPAAIGLLRQRFRYDGHVTIVGKGVGAEEGVAKFYLFGEADCYNTFSPKWVEVLADPHSTWRGPPGKTAPTVIDIPVTTLDQLMKTYGVPSYVKVDVEGYELPVIQGLHRPVPLLSFECHLPEYLDETVECLSRFARLAPSALFNYCIAEPPIEFESAQWLSYDRILDIVKAGEERFMEIYCRAPG